MKKRSLSLVLAFAMILALACGAWAALVPNADGVYEINTAAELGEFRDMVNAGSNDIDGKLMKNITMPSDPWMPIGNWVASTPGGALDLIYSYKGTFDGNGKKLDGLILRSSAIVQTRNGTYVAGLFGVIGAGGVVQNLLLTNVDIDLSGTGEAVAVAALVGHLHGGVIQNCGVTGGSIKGSAAAPSNPAAAFAGFTMSEEDDGSGAPCRAEVSNCYVSDLSSIENNGMVAGALGTVNNGTIVTNCYVSDIGLIKANGAGFAGGFAAWVRHDGATPWTSTLSNCYVQDIGEIIADGPADVYAGGIVGSLSAHEDTKIENCVYVAGTAGDTLSGTTHEGGIVGRISGTAPANLGKILNCLFPEDYFTFTNAPEDDRPVGNIAIAATPNVEQYSYSTASADSELDAIVAILEQGYIVTLVVGETYELDVTTIPGTVGNFVGHWESSNSGIVSVASEQDGLFATLIALEVGTSEVLVKVRGTVNVDLTCNVIVVDAVEAETDPTDSSIYLNDEDVNIVYNFEPYRVVGIDDSNLSDNGTGLSAIVDPDDDSKVLLTGKPLKSGSFFYVVTLESADGFQFTQTIPVVIQGGSRPTGGGGGSSNCNSGVGAAVFALLGLAFVYKKK